MRRVLALTLFTLTLVAAAPGAAHATGPEDLPLSHTTAVGVHNAYEKAKFPYLADALDSGSSLLELDVWSMPTVKAWRVGHDLPLIANNNNCANGGLRAGSRDQDLKVCLDNLRDWQTAHPQHPLLIVKVEMKNGFNGQIGLGAPQLDALITSKLGDTVFRPADLLHNNGRNFADLDSAAKADNWPTRSELRGKVMFEVINGTFEMGNPFDHYWTDAELADHLRSLSATGNIADAATWPSALGATAGDPRVSKYADAGRRPWFVVFDGAATSYVGGGIDPAWYDANHYFLIMTGADSVAPPIDSQHPTTAEARARIAQLAAAHASLVTSDWLTSTGVLADVLARG
ncbi:MAG: hypothetical protein QOJ50_1083 [Cryptosporangiaceae bacterium]|nr:hypothetical protein [Cryptosporangiaceae bacterium]